MSHRVRFDPLLAPVLSDGSEEEDDHGQAASALRSGGDYTILCLRLDSDSERLDISYILYIYDILSVVPGFIDRGGAVDHAPSSRRDGVA